jgi:pimeloyl-ACP methyl ester carboxylesterase
VRRSYCNVLRLLAVALTVWPTVAFAQAAQVPAPAVSNLKVFVRGAQIGTEQVTVTRSPAGIVVSGSSYLGPPSDILTNRCEVRYDAEWRPIEAAVDSVIRGVSVSLRARFADGVAAVQVEESGKHAARNDTVGADDVILLNSFFGLYEALAGRLHALQPGGQVKAYVIAEGEVTVQFLSATQERIQTPERTLTVRHSVLAFLNPGRPTVSAELWSDEAGRLVRFAMPSRAIEVVREDVASAASHREIIHRDGDESVRIPANGFTLAATVSRPAGAKAGPRYPAVVLVSGGSAGDRDELVANVPIFAQLAGALADAGFLVVRYDKRAIGQSGGRADHATLDDYADDVKAAVAYTRQRKDVDGKHVALLGYGDGGVVAMLASARNKQVAALALVAAPGVSGSEMVLAQQEHQLDRANLSPAERQAKIDLQKKIHKAVLTGSGWDDLPPAVRKQTDTPWFRSFLAFDPVTVMPRVPQSIMIVQGDLDREVFPSQADRLADLAHRRKAPANKAVTVVHVPGVNHLLVAATTGEPEEYATLADRNVSREALTPLLTWLQMTLEKKG